MGKTCSFKISYQAFCKIQINLYFVYVMYHIVHRYLCILSSMLFISCYVTFWYDYSFALKTGVYSLLIRQLGSICLSHTYSMLGFTTYIVLLFCDADMLLYATFFYILGNMSYLICTSSLYRGMYWSLMLLIDPLRELYYI